MEQTLRRKVLLSWLILIFLQTAASQSSTMYMMNVSPTTRSEMYAAASSTPTMIVSHQTRRSETTTSTEEKTREPTTRSQYDFMVRYTMSNGKFKGLGKVRHWFERRLEDSDTESMLRFRKVIDVDSFQPESERASCN